MSSSALLPLPGISLYTVSTHLRRIFAKLDVPARAAMVAVLSGNRHLLTTEQNTDGRSRVS